MNEQPLGGAGKFAAAHAERREEVPAAARAGAVEKTLIWHKREGRIEI